MQRWGFSTFQHLNENCGFSQRPSRIWRWETLCAIIETSEAVTRAFLSFSFGGGAGTAANLLLKPSTNKTSSGDDQSGSLAGQSLGVSLRSAPV